MMKENLLKNKINKILNIFKKIQPPLKKDGFETECK